MIRSIALDACETLKTTKSGEQKVAIFEKKLLRNIFNQESPVREKNEPIWSLEHYSVKRSTLKGSALAW